jgi:hypothetical protein
MFKNYINVAFWRINFLFHPLYNLHSLIYYSNLYAEDNGFYRIRDKR